MKATSIVLTGALIVFASVSVLQAADDLKDEKRAIRNPTARVDGERFLQREALGELVKASDVMGHKVKDPQGEDLGKLEDMAVDLESGRIVYVILGSGGVAGFGEKYVAVLPRSLHCDPAGNVVRADITKEQAKMAPSIELSKWEEQSRSNRVVEIYDHYHQHPYFHGPHEGNRILPPGRPLGYVARATKVIGMAVRNNADEKLGSVDNLMINLERGRIAQVIVSSGGFLGIGDELSAMPPSAFRYDHAHGLLRIEATRDDLTRAPHFKSSEWPNFGDPRYSERVYRAYHTEPYFRTDVDSDNNARNARDRDGTRLTPLDQGTSASDVATTKSIRQQLVADKDLSLSARNVKIITYDGRVTLRGSVRSQEERRRVAGIASRLVSAERVDNQLEVKAGTDY